MNRCAVASAHAVDVDLDALIRPDVAPALFELVLHLAPDPDAILPKFL